MFSANEKIGKNTSNDNKQLLDEDFCDIQNNQGGVISLSLRHRLITLTETLFIPDNKTTKCTYIIFTRLP